MFMDCDICNILHTQSCLLFRVAAVSSLSFGHDLSPCTGSDLPGAASMHSGIIFEQPSLVQTAIVGLIGNSCVAADHCDHRYNWR